MKKKKLFGTDGIRGEFKKWPLTKEVIYFVSIAISDWIKKKHKKTIKVVIGKDTRKSCAAIEKILIAGFKKNKATVYSAGVVPTPGLAYLANTMDVDLGVMISASHNPWQDNGIKFFKHNGYKLSEKEERSIEKIAFALLEKNKKTLKVTKIKTQKVSTDKYIKHLLDCVEGLDLRGKKIVADCANGAVSKYAGAILRSLGAKVIVLNNKPDGKNINCNCGSLHPELMAKVVKNKKADIGFSFDGDADRVMISDEKGRIIDGDYIMSVISKFFKENKCLKSNTVVGTSMTNFGLEKYLRSIKVNLLRADVGDKYVLEQMIKNKSIFGGEQSGHIIFLNHATTGDGLLTALQMLKVMQATKKKISLLATGWKKFPQLIKNVRVKEKKNFDQIEALKPEIKKAEQKLKNKGRLVLRYSGTEPLARIMLEAQDMKQIKKIADDIACAIEKEIGC